MLGSNSGPPVGLVADARSTVAIFVDAAAGHAVECWGAVSYWRERAAAGVRDHDFHDRRLDAGVIDCGSTLPRRLQKTGGVTIAERSSTWVGLGFFRRVPGDGVWPRVDDQVSQ